MHNIIKTCEALEDSGEARVSLIDCDAELKSQESIHDFLKFHNVKKEFAIFSLNSFANKFKFRGVKILTVFEFFLTNITLIRFLIKRNKEFEIIYFREHLLFPAAAFARYFLRKTVFFESHYIWNNWYGRLLTNLSIKISAGVIAISKALEKRFKKYNNNIITVFCAAPEFDFPQIYDKEKLRKKLELPAGKTIIGYTGNMSVTGLGDPFGVEEIIKSLKYLPEDFIFVGVGDKIGEAQFLVDLAKKEKLENRVMILPWCERKIIVDYLTAFDVLIIPKSGGAPGNMPTKTYEYLASNKPIVVCATEPILEVMRDQVNCLVVKTNSPEEWAGKIKEIYTNNSLAEKLIEAAKQDSKIYTWQNRAKLILDFIKSIYVKR
ncbi:MAG: glycosyltransferase [Nanoarchaeota archaeon]|nr:glycosyltransferase [Nanoarchaeota archaeon]